jgi:hypothetical protein
MSSAVLVFAVSTGVVVIVVAVCVVLVVLLVTLSMRGRRQQSSQRRADARRDLDAAQARGAGDGHERARDEPPERGI